MGDCLRRPGDGERVFCRGGSATPTIGPPCWSCCPPRSTRRPAILDRLAHEYELKDELDGAWAVRPLELVRERGRTMLVLEDPGGEPLDRLLGATHGGADASCASPSAIAAALGQAARARPHPQGHQAGQYPGRTARPEQVWLTGFGIASRLPRERQAPEPPEVDRRHARLHGARADRTDEPLDRFPQRPLCARRHPLRDAHRRAAVHRVRSDGVGPLPYRPTAGAARRAVARTSRQRSRRSS